MTQIKHSIPNEVEGKVALVTGAASGIGKAIALLLNARGAMVVAEDLNPAVEELARPGLVPLVADITEDGAAERAVGLAVETFGRLDILVNNAGIIINKLVIDMTREDWERIQSVNATAAFLLPRSGQGDDAQQVRSHRQHRLLSILFRIPDHFRLHRFQGRAGAADPHACAGGDRARYSCQCHRRW